MDVLAQANTPHESARRAPQFPVTVDALTGQPCDGRCRTGIVAL
jgi:hypothetical protein